MVQLAKADGLAGDRRCLDGRRGTSCATSAPTWWCARGDDVAARIREVVPGGVDGLADGSVQNTLVLPAVRDGGALRRGAGFAGDDRAGHHDPRRVGAGATSRSRPSSTGSASRPRTARSPCGWRAPSRRTQAAEAHRLLEAGGTRGRFVLEF